MGVGMPPGVSVQSVENLFDCRVPIEALVELAVSVGGGADGSEVDVCIDGGEIWSDPGDAVWLQCMGRDVLYPSEAGKVGEPVDV